MTGDFPDYIIHTISDKLFPWSIHKKTAHLPHNEHAEIVSKPIHKCDKVKFAEHRTLD